MVYPKAIVIGPRTRFMHVLIKAPSFDLEKKLKGPLTGGRGGGEGISILTVDIR